MALRVVARLTWNRTASRLVLTVAAGGATGIITTQAMLQPPRPNCLIPDAMDLLNSPSINVSNLVPRVVSWHVETGTGSRVGMIVTGFLHASSVSQLEDRQCGRAIAKTVFIQLR